MKAKSYRTPLKSHNDARIIKSSSDSSQDIFIPLSEALELYDKGKLISVDLGPSYPNSFIRT